MTDKTSILTAARDGRVAEVQDYQINIDNYRRAIVLSSADRELRAFTKQLKALLASSLLEQKKAKVMLTVIEDQLREVPK